MSHPSHARSRVAELLILALLAASGALPAFALEVHRFDIPEGDAAVAIRDFGEQAHVQILVAGEAVKGKTLHAVTGNLSTEDGLNALLSGSGLTHQYVGDHSIALRAAQARGAEASTQSQVAGAGGADSTQEGKSNSSQDFRVAQVDQTPAGAQVGESDASSKKKETLEEIVVTGSRIPTRSNNGAEDVRVYDSHQIEQSGQSTVAAFLNTISSVSIAVQESGALYNYQLGGTTVQLRGLPAGTTLVLINGHRVETSGIQTVSNFFDLNNIPVAAVDRIEVVANGSSAIYGSDAIAGVVNIILKSNFSGGEINARYGGAQDTDETDANAAWGTNWGRAKVSLIASYQARGDLLTNDRGITANNDYTAFGSSNNNFPTCNPGNVFFPNGYSFNGGAPVSYAAVPSGATGKLTVRQFAATAGTLNSCSILLGAATIPKTDRAGLFLSADFDVTENVSAYGEVLYSHVKQYALSLPSTLFGVPGFQQFTAGPGNPYNPFGQTVGVAYALPGKYQQDDIGDTDFVRPLLGMRGNFAGDWHWEVSALASLDETDETYVAGNPSSPAIQAALNSSDPSVALNPFGTGPLGPSAELSTLFGNLERKWHGQGDSLSGFVRGPAVQLPSGAMQVVVGAEYNYESLYANRGNQPGYPPNSSTTNSRHTTAAFVEARVPILADPGRDLGGESLALTLAGRYDNYSDFGSTTNPQAGLEWRPLKDVLIRATYARAFDAPTLYDLYAPQISSPGIVTDPTTGKLVDVPAVTFGGNLHLQPERGESDTIGLVYSGAAIPNVRLSITGWRVLETNTIQPSLSAQYIVDNFPSRVTRDPVTGAITGVDNTTINFGSIEVAGVDYAASAKWASGYGEWSTSLNVSQTVRYRSVLVPGGLAQDSLSEANMAGWAPRWKGNLALGWTRGALNASVTGRYVGKYRDYNPLPDGDYLTLGNSWLFDANVRYAIGEQFASGKSWARGAYAEIGGVNIFDRLPQFSTFLSYLGYDPSQADIRGRFLYVQLGLQW